MQQLKVPDSIRLTEAVVATIQIQGREITTVYGKLMPSLFGALAVANYQRIAMVKGMKHL